MIKKILLSLTTVALAIVVIFSIAVIWPLPNLVVPNSHESILIKSIAIVDVLSGELIPNQDVLIKKNRIIDIDSSGQITSTATFVINGFGKFLMPGLWDMHTHSSPLSPWIHHPFYIVNGVTGIRDMSGNLDKPDSHWSGTAQRKKWNQALVENNHIGPRYILQSSFQINGSSSVPNDSPDFFKVEKKEDVSQLLEFYQKEGTDFIKIYAEIPAASYKRLAKDVTNYNMHIAGHKALNISLKESINLGQRSFEHGRIFMYDCFPGAEKLRLAENKREVFSQAMSSMVTDFDEKKAIKLMNLMREKNAHWTPTLQTLKMSAYADNEQFVGNPHLKYIPTAWKWLIWKQDIGRAAKRNKSTEGAGINMRYYKASQSQVGMAAKKGVPIMLGTDVTDTYVFPGFSVHTELLDLKESGLTNLQALQSATIVPAKFAYLEKDYGSIEIGKVADLVILNGDPLEKIEHTKFIYGVFLNGIFYNEQKLEELKNTGESVTSSFHLNAKFVYNLFSSPLMRKQFAD